MADFDTLGQQVRQAWIDYCLETGDRTPSHIAPWAEIGEWDREADRRIARALTGPFMRDRYRLEEEVEQQRARIAELERENAALRLQMTDENGHPLMTMSESTHAYLVEEMAALRAWQERARPIVQAVVDADVIARGDSDTSYLGFCASDEAGEYQRQAHALLATVAEGEARE